MSAVRLGAQSITLPPSGDNPQASVMQAIGPVRVTIDYSSPRVVRNSKFSAWGEVEKGKNDRRGKIWGDLVPYGMSDLGFNSCASCPWRAGANENTTFTVTHDVQVQGQKLAAGTYGLHMIPGKDEWTIIFSRDTNAWGSYWYDAKNDALRVQTKPAKSEYHEWLTYEFTERESAKAKLAGPRLWDVALLQFERQQRCVQHHGAHGRLAPYAGIESGLCRGDGMHGRSR